MRSRSLRKREQSPRSVSLVVLKRLVKQDDPAPVVRRPQTRGDCATASRPCPYVGCRYHLYLDAKPASGSITFNFPDLEFDELEDTCALDVAAGGDKRMEDVADLMNITRERVRQILAGVLKRLGKNGDVEKLSEVFFMKGKK